jgi:hypothetical protein
MTHYNNEDFYFFYGAFPEDILSLVRSLPWPMTGGVNEFTAVKSNNGDFHQNVCRELDFAVHHSSVMPKYGV